MNTDKPKYKCQECGLEVENIRPYKKGECPDSMTGHRFEEIRRIKHKAEMRIEGTIKIPKEIIYGKKSK